MPVGHVGRDRPRNVRMIAILALGIQLEAQPGQLEELVECI